MAGSVSGAAPAAMEMQRRLMVAITSFQVSSDTSANRMFGLTWMIFGLTAIQVVAALLAAFLTLKSIRSADTPRPASTVATAPTSGALAPIGRYAFSIDPTTQNNAFGGGFVLDSTTGELWTIGYETANGKLGRRISIPLGRVETPQNTEPTRR